MPRPTEPIPTENLCPSCGHGIMRESEIRIANSNVYCKWCQCGHKEGIPGRQLVVCICKHCCQERRKKDAELLTCVDCGKKVESARAGLYNGKCWDCAMGHSIPANAVKRLRLALDTLRMYPQCQFVPGQDGYAALSVLEDHIKTLEAIIQPRVEFKDIANGEQVNFWDQGKWTEEKFIKIASEGWDIPGNAASMLTGKLCYIAPNTPVRIIPHKPVVEPHHYSA